MGSLGAALTASESFIFAARNAGREGWLAAKTLVEQFGEQRDLDLIPSLLQEPGTASDAILVDQFFDGLERSGAQSDVWRALEKNVPTQASITLIAQQLRIMVRASIDNGPQIERDQAQIRSIADHPHSAQELGHIAALQDEVTRLRQRTASSEQIDQAVLNFAAVPVDAQIDYAQFRRELLDLPLDPDRRTHLSATLDRAMLRAAQARTYTSGNLFVWLANPRSPVIVRSFLRHRTDFDEPGTWQMTPLCYVARMGDVELLQIFLDAGADPNRQSGLAFFSFPVSRMRSRLTRRRNLPLSNRSATSQQSGDPLSSRGLGTEKAAWRNGRQVVIFAVLS